MTLLYIDDDLDDRLIFREAVSQLGISVELIEAGDGDAGMKVLESTIPDLSFSTSICRGHPVKKCS